MPIDFTCPECQRHYRVKDELAGKGAKCGKCGHKMRIPALKSATTTSAPASKAPATKAPASTKSPSASTPQRAPVAAKKPQPAAASPGPSAGSWLDEELETSQPAVATVPMAGASCPSCGAALAANAVLCVTCGFDLRTHSKLETRHAIDLGETDKPSPKKRTALSGAASLVRGTVFSFIAAVVGAAIWAGLAVLTDYEFGLVAWGLSGLVGFGMALGHEDEDGTFAGIIAAFMSLFGIVAAKILIVVMVVAPAIMGGAFGELENFDPVELQRELTASAIAEERLEKDGIDIDNVTDEQWDQALAAASAEVASMSEDELTKRLEQIEGRADEAQDAPELVAGQNAADDIAAPDGNDVAPGLIALFFALMFSPIDGIFILLAFFTAYKVGSGQIGD